MVILYLAVLITAVYWLSKILLPEMIKPPVSEVETETNSYDPDQHDGPDHRIKKLETLLVEKNKNIKLLQNELTIFLIQVREFGKIKSLLEDEVHRLREQNRIFRSELGLPANQPKENSMA